VRLLLLTCALVLTLGCQTREESTASGVIIVNAPATGTVRRVLVREGAAVNEGEAIVEIAVDNGQAQRPPVAQQTEDPQARAARNVTTAQSEIEAARAEVVRTEVEVQRLTPLVAAGQATQGELDGARAQYDQAQQRFRHAQESAQNAQTGLVASRQQTLNAASTPTPVEQLVVARASSAGTVAAISARVGDRVSAGQPLATLRADAH
jgi:membrane fusion protein (multidrug efflux system)